MKPYASKFKEDIIPTEVTFNTDATKAEEQILRTAIASELGAINLYQQMIDSTQSEEVRKILQDIIDEEKIHVGEFELILSKFVDSDNSNLQIQGAQEAKKVVNENFIKYKVKKEEVIMERYKKKFKEERNIKDVYTEEMFDHVKDIIKKVTIAYKKNDHSFIINKVIEILYYNEALPKDHVSQFISHFFKVNKNWAINSVNKVIR